MLAEASNKPRAGRCKMNAMDIAAKSVDPATIKLAGPVEELAATLRLKKDIEPEYARLSHDMLIQVEAYRLDAVKSGGRLVKTVKCGLVDYYTRVARFDGFTEGAAVKYDVELAVPLPDAIVNMLVKDYGAKIKAAYTPTEGQRLIAETSGQKVPLSSWFQLPSERGSK